MKVAICDDNLEDANIIFHYCQICELSYEKVIFSSASQLLDAFSSVFFDLIFLDIEMEHPNGYEVGVKLSKMNPRPVIVFITNSSSYAILGYGVAFRYLCKPISLSVFRQTLMELSTYLLPKKVILSYNGKQKIISINEILYFESLSHHIIFHLKNDESFEIKDSMENMLQKFTYPNFFQIHRSFCVNLDYIDNIKSQVLTMTDRTEIPISRKKHKQLREQLAKWMNTTKF